jgi:hypothetical protein
VTTGKNIEDRIRKTGRGWQCIDGAKIVDASEPDRSERSGCGPACYCCRHLDGGLGAATEVAVVKKKGISLINLGIREPPKSNGIRKPEPFIRLEALRPIIQFLPFLAGLFRRLF